MPAKQIKSIYYISEWAKRKILNIWYMKEQEKSEWEKVKYGMKWLKDVEIKGKEFSQMKATLEGIQDWLNKTNDALILKSLKI